IHPFQDGNGRLSRVLTTLLLLRAGYGYVAYSSLERVIEENKDEYYLTLRRAQSTLNKDEQQLHHWVAFFVQCLKKQKDTLKQRVEREQLVGPLAPLSEKLVSIVRERGRVTVRDAQAVTGANRNTIKDHLSQLVQAGHLTRRGRGRGTWYERP
ncbi:MAG: DUF977 family protein, partial [Proteobacteria bacterium]|nr:DUF977 family protein [Pseudomonadota bacterium]